MIRKRGVEAAGLDQLVVQLDLLVGHAGVEDLLGPHAAGCRIVLCPSQTSHVALERGDQGGDRAGRPPGRPRRTPRPRSISRSTAAATRRVVAERDLARRVARRARDRLPLGSVGHRLQDDLLGRCPLRTTCSVGSSTCSMYFRAVDRGRRRLRRDHRAFVRSSSMPVDVDREAVPPDRGDRTRERRVVVAHLRASRRSGRAAGGTRRPSPRTSAPARRSAQWLMCFSITAGQAPFQLPGCPTAVANGA